MAQCHNFKDLMDTGATLMQLIDSCASQDQVDLVKKDRRKFDSTDVDTRSILSQMLNGLSSGEEVVGQRLVDLEERRCRTEQEIQDLEVQLRRHEARNGNAESDVQFLQGELTRLRNGEHETHLLQQEVDDDTTEIIPTSIYKAQLFHKVTKIKWEHDTAPHILKGVHYGAELATPILIDTSAQSRCDVSDQLWAFVGGDTA